MGVTVLLALALVEVLTLIISIAKRSSSQAWLRTRTIVSVCEVIALGLLMALSVSGMAFDFRWMALLVLLAARAAISLVVLFARRGSASPAVAHSVPRMAFNVIGSIAVIALAVVPALVFPPYSGLPTTGDYEVGEAHAILVDSSRTDPFEQDGSYREVPIWFYYPDAADAEAHTFPLIVFSHGAFGYHESNYSLYTELASHGYVVASLDYPHHSFFATDTQGDTVIVDSDFISQAIAVQGGEVSDDESYELARGWMELRMADLGFALDATENAARNGITAGETWFFESDEQRDLVGEALRLASVEKIGLVGHSMGGATSVGQGRIRSEVGAVIDLDGTMFTERSLKDDGSYVFDESPYPAPLLSVDSEEHYKSGKEAKEQGVLYVNNVVLENASHSAHTYFEGSGHMNFTDLPLFSPMLASLLGTGDIDAQACLEQTNALVLAWFDEHLKGGQPASIAESY